MLSVPVVRLSMRLLVPALAGCLFLGSCGGELSLPEYVEEVEQLVVTMNFGLDSLDPLLADPNPSLADVRAYASGRVESREDFLEALTELEPPERVEDLHVALVDVLTRLTAAESAMADEILDLDEGADLSDLWASDAGQAALAVDAEAVAFCRAAEAEFDATDQPTFGEDAVWVPAEMKEVIRVAFYCDRSDRPG